MTLAIHELEARHDLRREDVEAFLQEHTFPITEGRSVTFVFHGHADAVFVRHWIHGLTASQELTRLHGTDLWYLVLELPERSRVEYKLEVVQHGRPHLVRDPLNPQLAHDPFGANSVVHSAGYGVPEWTHEDPEARRGRMEELVLHSSALGGDRLVQVYVPARFREERRYPLLVLHDGTDFLNYARLGTVLDNLVHRLEIPPMIVAFTDAGNRLEEYADNEAHGRHLVEELVPELERRFPVVDEPSSRCLVGASFGAVATLSTAWRNPGFFGNLFLLSGSFAFTDIGDHDAGPLFDPVVEFVNAFRDEPGRCADRVYLCCGTYEPLIYYNRSMVPLLQSTGMDVRYAEARDGHNWENWRDRMREGLSWLFPGPLWMVYE
jgi:enterochelin esterase family protein